MVMNFTGGERLKTGERERRRLLKICGTCRRGVYGRSVARWVVVDERRRPLKTRPVGAVKLTVARWVVVDEKRRRLKTRRVRDGSLRRRLNPVRGVYGGHA